MENINILDVLTLDDNKEYMVTNKVKLNDIKYYFLVNRADPADFKFVYQNEDELIEVEDPEFIKELMIIFYQKSADK